MTKHQKYLIIALFILHLIPIWAFKFIPTQDGLNHIYNAYVLKEYNNPEYTKFREVYRLNIKPFPNWGAHAFFFAALYVMPPLVAEKLYVTLCVVLLPLGFFYFLKSVDRRLMIFGFLGFLYSFNQFINLGFYGFALSFSIYFFVMGYWWRYRDNLSISRAVILNLLIAVIYFCHLFSYTMALLSISLLAAASAVLPGDRPRSAGERVKPLAYNIAALIPAYFVFVYLLATNPESREMDFRSFKELWQFFMSAGSLLSFNDRAVPLMWCLLVFMGICFLWNIIIDKIVRREFISQREGFFALFCIFVILYFKLPWAVGPPAWINPRLHLFLFPVLLAWFSFTYPKWVKAVFISIMIILSLAHLGMISYDYYLLNKDMQEFTSGAHLIAPNSAVSIIGSESLDTEHHGSLKYMSPFYHDTCYYCLGNGSVYVGNYEPKYCYFPLQYREGYWKFQYEGVIDYMLVWQTGENDENVLKLEKDYILIHETRNLKLFQHKQVSEKD